MTDEPGLPRRNFPWRAAARALAELAWARLRHLRLPVASIHQLNRRSATGGRAPEAALAGDSSVIDTVAHVIPRVAYRLPWRSDCLPQAMAAQHWLDCRGIATSIVIGVDSQGNGEFASHAWLQYGDRIVTGGDVANFHVMLQTPCSSID